jgi:hypothetical protein
VLRDCALKRSANAQDVVDVSSSLSVHTPSPQSKGGVLTTGTGYVSQALTQFEQAGVPVAASAVEGKWELVFSSSMQKVPLLKGYMPVREIITFDQVRLPASSHRRLDATPLSGSFSCKHPLKAAHAIASGGY